MYLPVIKKTYFEIIFLSTLCLFLVGCAPKSPPQINDVQNAALHASRYLTKKIKESGMFEYRINMNPIVEVKDKYNILRHAGTLYAMSTYYQFHPEPNALPAIIRAGKYFRDNSIHPIPSNNNISAVWSKPEVNNSGRPLMAKLGGTGLGLVALLSIEKIHPGYTPLSDLQSLGRFIVYMQKENGSFHSLYIPSAGGRWDNWHSLYYPGEAVLGLLMLYEKDPSEIWIKSATKALTYLAYSRLNKADLPADHWTLLATEKLFSLRNIKDLPVAREAIIYHAAQICDAILQKQIKGSEQPANEGGFSEDGRTTPTATNLEGLQAALSFLPRNHEKRIPIESAVHRGISFLLQAQIKEGEFTGAVPRAVDKIDSTLPDADRFNRRATEVRIDYVQHALSAFVQYIHLMHN